MFDFNCDVAQGYGVYKNEGELEIAKYASSINISAGFHAGDPSSIRKALMFAQEPAIISDRAIICFFIFFLILIILNDCSSWILIIKDFPSETFPKRFQQK